MVGGFSEGLPVWGLSVLAGVWRLLSLVGRVGRSVAFRLFLRWDLKEGYATMSNLRFIFSIKLRLG